MAQPPTQHEPAGRSAAYPGTPRWVKLSAIVALVLALLVVAVMAVAGGEHGPGRHMPAGGAAPAGQVAPKP
jgi:hypothetical protein